MVVRGDEDIPEANNTDKEKDAIPAIGSILQCIKQSEDVVNPEKSKNSHAISDIGLLVIKRLAEKSSDYQGAYESVSLPSTLYKPIDSKGENTEAVAVQTWLADDSVGAHFESLAMDVNGTVHLEIPQDEILEDIETETNEMPLGKLIKRIKSEKNKSKTAVKNNSSSAELKNDDDILKVVREINMDNQGFPTKTEPSNGHDNNLISEKRNGEENQGKKRKCGDAKATVIPKRRRSLSARNPSVYSSSRSAKASTKVSLKTPLQGDNEPSEPDLLVSPVKRKQIHQGCEESNDEEDNEETDVSDQKRAKSVATDTGSSVRNDTSSVGSLKKQKRKSTTGLAKCTSNNGGGHTTDLVDCRIKIWWPMDKRFYEGVVKSYDPDRKKHVVLYDDGDVEVLRLEKEHWELIDNEHRPKRKTITTKSPLKVISAKKSKLSDRSEKMESAKRSSGVKGKRAQKKNLKLDKKKVLVDGNNAAASEEVENRSDISNVEPTVSSDIDEIGAADVEQDLAKDVAASEECDVEGTTGSAGQGGNEDAAGTDSDDSCEDAKYYSPKTESENGHPKGAEESPFDSASDMGKSHQLDTNTEKPSQEEFDAPNTELIAHAADASNTEDGEDADDKPLSTWKQRLGKSRRTK